MCHVIIVSYIMLDMVIQWRSGDSGMGCWFQ